MPPDAALREFAINMLAFVPAFGFSDRFNGGGFGWKRLAHDHGGPLHGRGMYYVALPLAALCYILGGWLGLVLGLAWGIYRGAFSFPDNTITGRDREATIIRHALMWPVALALVVGFHLKPVMLLPFVLYTVVAVVLAKWDGDEQLDTESASDVNGLVETMRGGVFGMSLAGALALA